jgi:transporter family-2 protein
MAAGGVAGTVQVAIMGRFGERIGAVEALAFSTLVTALVALAALVVVRQGVSGYEAALRSPAWLWLGGLCGAFIVFSITVAAPRIGTTASVAIFIAFQLAASAVVDRWGLFGLERIPLGWERLVGLALLAAGAALSLQR